MVKLSDFIKAMEEHVEQIHKERAYYVSQLHLEHSDYYELVSLIEECDERLVEHANYLANLEECRGTPAPWRYQ